VAPFASQLRAGYTQRERSWILLVAHTVGAGACRDYVPAGWDCTAGTRVKDAGLGPDVISHVSEPTQPAWRLIVIHGRLRSGRGCDLSRPRDHECSTVGPELSSPPGSAGAFSAAGWLSCARLSWSAAARASTSCIVMVAAMSAITASFSRASPSTTTLCSMPSPWVFRRLSPDSWHFLHRLAHVSAAGAAVLAGCDQRIDCDDGSDGVPGRPSPSALVTL
jgi:hypothetical protein